MAFFTWKESFNTGITVIDSQHRSIVDTINELHNNRGHEDREIIVATIMKLAQYSLDHFAAEEQLFDLVGYPDSKAHCLQHQLFREKLIALEDDFSQGRTGILGDTLQFLKEWFIDHILNLDMQFKPYIGTITGNRIL